MTVPSADRRTSRTIAGALATRTMNTPGPRMRAQILLRDQMLAFPRRAVDHRDGVAGGPGPYPPREPPRQAHQVSVVQHRIRLRVTPPIMRRHQVRNPPAVFPIG